MSIVPHNILNVNFFVIVLQMSFYHSLCRKIFRANSYLEFEQRERNTFLPKLPRVHCSKRLQHKKIFYGGGVLKILIVDDGVGAFATLSKLRYALSAHYVVHVLNQSFPLCEKTHKQLMMLAQRELQFAKEEQCDVVVFSSIALSMATVKTLSATSETPLFGCEAPILHASTYTASQVLLAGDAFSARLARRYPNVISVPLKDFPHLAESGASEREIANYVSDNVERYSGTFDCIALGSSSMNLYKHCFFRVFPNAQIFDSLEGVARKLRKKYKKYVNTEISVQVLGEQGESLMEKYNFFIDEIPQGY